LSTRRRRRPFRAAALRICGAKTVARSIYDARGPEFTLLRFDSAVNVAVLETAARNRGVPLKVLDIERPSAVTFYGRGLVLSRPDQHVAWAGDSLPVDPLALIDRVRGSIGA
jgi:hypothetical protein